MMVRDSPRRVSSFRALAACRTEQRLSRALPSKGSVPINQERVRKLMEHGLTEYQARVYLTLLDLGAATATQISRLSKFTRTRSCAPMQQLHHKGPVQILTESPLRNDRSACPR